MASTTVDSSSPRCCRSSSKAERGLVQGGSQIVPQPLVVVLVGVPGPVSVSGGGHKATAGFHQATSQQHALTDSGASVGLLGPVRLLGQIEGLLDAGRKQHGQGLVGEAVHPAEFGMFLLPAEPKVHRLHKRPAVGNIGSRQGIGQGQVRNLKGLLAGIGQNDGIVFRTQKGRGVGIHVGKEIGLLMLRTIM